jgi:hypothetical protein
VASGRVAVAVARYYGRPVLDPTTVFDDSGPFEARLNDEVLRTVEAQLGLRLPEAYVALARGHNGGYFAHSAHPAPRRTTWADDHVGVVSLAAIGRTARFSLCGELGSAFWIAEWGYPDIGVYMADCPSAGHDMIALDYRRPGEPAVVHVDQEWDYQITVLAPDFEAFIRGLTAELDYDERNEDR